MDWEEGKKYEKKDFRKLYEKLVKSDWFKKAYNNKSLGECPLDFPELREDESEDERIRKEIIKFIQDFCNPCDPDCDKWIAYLEKLKGQKPVNVHYVSGIREELLGIEDNAKNIDGLTESQWVAIRAAHRLLGEYVEQEQKPVEIEEIIRKAKSEGRQEVIDNPEYYQLQKPEEWQKQEWSEDDEEMLNWCESVVRGFEIDHCNDDKSHSDWLKSLRPTTKK